MTMHLFRTLGLAALALYFSSTAARATSNYEYGADEYVTVSSGISPNGKYAITTHGEGELGDQNFHVYLFDAAAGKKIGPLEEIKDSLDTGAGAFGARWSQDSSTVTIVYRVDRHAPLKEITYHIEGRHAKAASPEPLDVKAGGTLEKYWQTQCADSKPSPKTFGAPKKKN